MATHTHTHTHCCGRTDRTGRTKHTVQMRTVDVRSEGGQETEMSTESEGEMRKGRKEEEKEERDIGADITPVY